MDYLQYVDKIVSCDTIPCNFVLNLIINGLPSIQKRKGGI